VDENAVLKALYDRYIAPTKRKRDQFIGIEIEMPIINLNSEAVDFTIVHKLTDAFAEHFKMKSIGVDDEGYTYSIQNYENGDNLSYDCSYNNLELSLGREKNINILNERFKEYYSFIISFFKHYNYTLTGMGVNPYRKINRCVPLLNERYRMLFHHLGLHNRYTHPDFFHNYPDFGTFTSASQVQIDVDYSNLIDTINIFSKLEPIKSLLFSNSVMDDDEKDLLCVRDMFWENSTHGINPKNIGMFEQELADENELFEYIKQTSIYCTMRNGKYINFEPTPILDYFKSEYITGEFWNGNKYEKITFKPELEDLNHHRTFKFEDLTYRGTIEFRSCCCQPISDSMTVAAFHAGLYNNLSELKALMDNDEVIYGHGLSASELRKKFNRGEIPEYIDTNNLQKLVLEILNLAKKGLAKRGFNEEHFLTPLYERVKQKTNPALEYRKGRLSGVDISELIRRYSRII
jgi:gamma-glutamylcysteine synthetase